MKLLLYCTKSKPYLYRPYEWDCFRFDEASRFYLGNEPLVEIDEKYNGKIVAECDYEVEEFDYMKPDCIFTPTYLSLLKQSCLTDKEMFDYLKGKNGYTIHIKNLNIFDEPRELNDLEPKREIHQCIHGNLIIDEELEIPIKAPQNMMRVKLRKSYYNGIPVSNNDINANEETLEDYILISIRPEWLCKILNGEKTIEVRKKVLKGMK